ncbi:MAG: hypothetical protein WCP03_02925 [Candidatus Saccharibacteria bacterium]
MRILNIGIISVGLLSASLVSIPVLAVSANSHSNAQTPSVTPTTNANGQATERKEAVKTKLADTKLKACQNRQKAVNNIMSRISDRGQKQLDLFTTIATRTEKFYKDKGKTLSNYEALLADVTANKTAAQTTIDAIKADSVTFKCDGTDPKGAVSAFKESLKSEIAALKAYKTSVKNLIVGVKSVQSTVSASPSVSPTPTIVNTTQGVQ